jgi:class 3 adenylate cyclase
LKRKSGDEYERKLLTIMFTDIVAYSRIMNKDERLAIRLLEDHNLIMRECIGKFAGNIVEIIGDAFLVSFTSAVAAVNCAVEAQRLLGSYNMLKPDTEKIKIRIGIHLGDVIEFEGKLKGDVINIAARIQQNAEPGCISVSKNVYDVVKNKTSHNINTLGKFSGKNIKEELELFSVLP